MQACAWPRANSSNSSTATTSWRPIRSRSRLQFLRAAPDVDVVYGDARQFQSAAGSTSWEDWDGRDYPDMLATLLSPDGNGCGLVVHSLIFRRRALELVGPWNENPAISDGAVTTNMADQDYWLRAAWAGCKFRYCPGSLCFQRRRSGQLSSNPGRWFAEWSQCSSGLGNISPRNRTEVRS